jgi:hypothetical protein
MSQVVQVMRSWQLGLRGLANAAFSIIIHSRKVNFLFGAQRFLKESKVSEVRSQESRSGDLLLPAVVGFIFIVALFAGALLG